MRSRNSLLVARPVLLGEDLHLAEAAEAGRLHPAPDLRGGRCSPRRAGRDPAADPRWASSSRRRGRRTGARRARSAGSRSRSVGIPPQVVDVDRHAHVVGADGLGDVVGLAPGVDGRAIVGVHRVQRLDGQPHPVRLGVGQHRLDAGADLIARRRQRLARHRPADQHHERRAQRGGLVDGPAVVVQRLVAGPPASRCGKKPPRHSETISRPWPRSSSPACAGSCPARASRQTVMPLTPALA